MSDDKRECPVCLRRYVVGPEFNLLCPRCEKSMGRAKTGDDYALIVWAANRARRFAAKARRAAA